MGISNNVPVISVVGWANSGKTTFIEQLIREMKSRGYRVGTVKHHHGEVDKPGKDTWIHSRAGAEAVALAGNSGFALFKKWEKKQMLDEIRSYMPELDIIITEGFKSGSEPKIEIRRENASPVARKEEVIAIVGGAKSEIDVPSYNYSDIRGVANLIEEKFFSRQPDPEGGKGI